MLKLVTLICSSWDIGLVNWCRSAPGFAVSGLEQAILSPGQNSGNYFAPIPLEDHSENKVDILEMLQKAKVDLKPLLSSLSANKEKLRESSKCLFRYCQVLVMQYLKARGLVFRKPPLPSPGIGRNTGWLTLLKTQYSTDLSCVNVITGSFHPNLRMTSGLYQTALLASNDHKLRSCKSWSEFPALSMAFTYTFRTGDW